MFSILFSICFLFLNFSTSVYAAETACINNGGPIGRIGAVEQSTVTNLTLPVDFGDETFIYDLNVSADITHQWMGDLTLSVTNPNSGTEVFLFERPGTIAPNSAPTQTTPFGCGQNDLNAVFDDQSSNPPIENEACTSSPVFTGDYQPHNPSPTNLTAFDGQNVSGDWNVYISDSGNSDSGVLNEVCITASFAGVTFDKWVSTNATCSDTLDDLTVSAGTPVYYCYTVSNPSTELFTINPGDTSDDQGLDISGLEGTYAAGSSKTVIVPLIAGTDTSLGETINIAEITATFATLNFMGELITEETARLNVPPPVIEISKTANVISDPVNTTNPKAIPGAIVEYTILVTNSGLGSTDVNTIIINDPIPANTRLFFGTPTNPIAFSDGTTASGLSFNFETLASTTDDIAFSNDGGVSTVPLVTLDADGFDATTPPINHISINPKGIFNSSNGTDTPSFEIKFRVRVE